MSDKAGALLYVNVHFNVGSAISAPLQLYSVAY